METLATGSAPYGSPGRLCLASSVRFLGALSRGKLVFSEEPEAVEYTAGLPTESGFTRDAGDWSKLFLRTNFENLPATFSRSTCHPPVASSERVPRFEQYRILRGSLGATAAGEDYNSVAARTSRRPRGGFHGFGGGQQARFMASNKEL